MSTLNQRARIYVTIKRTYGIPRSIVETKHNPGTAIADLLAAGLVTEASGRLYAARTLSGAYVGG